MISASIRRKMLISIAFGIAVMVALSIYGDLPKLAHVVSGFDWTLLPAILGLTMLNYGLRFVKWQYLLQAIGVRNLKVEHSFLVFFSGLSMVITPGKIGEWLKSYLLKQYTGTPISASAPIILVERLSDGLAMAVLASSGLLLTGAGWQILLAAGIVGLLAVVLSQYRPFARLVLKLVARVPFASGRVSSFEAFYVSAKQMLHWRVFGPSVVLGIISWSAEGVAFYLALVALGVATTPALAIEAISILSTATIAGALSMLPGGLAVAEGSITGLLMLYGVTDDPAIAAAATLIIRFATLWFGVSLGVITLSVIARQSASGDRSPRPMPGMTDSTASDRAT